MGFILGGIGSICLIAMYISVFRDIGIDVLFNLNAFLIVVGGTITALFVGFPVKRITTTVNDIMDAFREGSTKKDMVNEIVEIARINRRADLKKLEKKITGSKDAFLKLGINLLINHYKNEEIRNYMEREMAARIVSLNLSQNVLMTMARLTPSFGLAGTVISLIKIFKHFQSFEMIIPVMGIALMSTFYGVVLSNLILLPLSAKIKESAIICEEQMQMVIEGIIEVSNGEHPLKIEEKLLGYGDVSRYFDAAGSLKVLRVVKS